MQQTTPRIVARIARNSFAVTAPLPPAILITWVVGMWPPERPYVAVMVFMLSVCAVGAVGIVWALSVCHMAIASAFAAGLGVGRVAAPTPPAIPVQADLRVVE